MATIIQYRAVEDLHKLDDNPRSIDTAAFKILCDSLKKNPRLFEVRPILLSNRTGKLVILAGNQRFEAALHIKLKQVPTILMEDLTEDQEREIIIKDNHSAGDWDWEKLGSSSWNETNLASWGVIQKSWAVDYSEKSESESAKKKKITLSFDPDTFLDVRSDLNDIGTDFGSTAPGEIVQQLIAFYKEKKPVKTIERVSNRFS